MKKGVSVKSFQIFVKVAKVLCIHLEKIIDQSSMSTLSIAVDHSVLKITKYKVQIGDICFRGRSKVLSDSIQESSEMKECYETGRTFKNERNNRAPRAKLQTDCRKNINYLQVK